MSPFLEGYKCCTYIWNKGEQTEKEVATLPILGFFFLELDLLEFFLAFDLI